MRLFATILLFLKMFVCFSDGLDEEGCASVQYLELGRSGTIVCSFHEHIFALYWHNSTDVTKAPIAVLKESVKSGAGYLSGDFDVYHNGSLVINRVSLEHEHSFAVLKFDSSVDDPDIYVVSVKTFLEPKEPYPLVPECRNQGKMCLLESRSSAPLNCSVVSSRPAINLKWVIRTNHGDMEMPSEKTVVVDGPAEYSFTSHVTTRNAFNYTHLITLLACKAAGIGEVIQKGETQVLLLNRDFNFSSLLPHVMHFQNEKRMVLKCGKYNRDHSFLVWMRLVNDEYQYVLYSFYNGEKFTTTYGNGYDLGSEGSLLVPVTEIQYEGLYYCIYGNGETEGVHAIDVSIYVKPPKAYPIIDGCTSSTHCILELPENGNIACFVYDIRPQIELEWVFSLEEDSPISFTSTKLVVQNNRETFDVSLTTHYHASAMSGNNLTIECKLSGPNAKLFDFQRAKVHLIFANGKDNADTSNKESSLLVVVFVIVIILVVVVLLTLGGLLICKARHRSSTSSKSQGHKMDKGEDIPLRLEEAETTENKVFKEGQVTSIAQHDLITYSHQYALLAGMEQKALAVSKEKYTLLENQTLSPYSGKKDLAIVVLGKTGVGKSATANSVLGEKIFREDLHTEPVTQTLECQTRRINGREISVIDTPGLHDTDYQQDKMKTEVAEIKRILKNGIDAFIYVLSVAAPRLNEADVEAIQTVENEFGANIQASCILVYSHAEFLKTDTTLDQFLHDQKKGSEKLSSYFKRFKAKVVAVNNSSNIPAEKERNQNAIIALID